MFNNDTTKCFAKNCDKKNNCYRYTVKSDILQSYAYFEPECFDTRSYKYYINSSLNEFGPETSDEEIKNTNDFLRRLNEGDN